MKSNSWKIIAIETVEEWKTAEHAVIHTIC